MRKLLSGLATVALAISSFTITAAPAFAVPGDFTCELAVGDGTVGNPYQVGTRTQLEEIVDCDSQSTSRYFIQTQNIDLSGSAWTPINFYGKYNGDGKSINGLSINLPTTDNVGLFATTGDAASVEDLTINVTSIVGRDSVGALAGMWQGEAIGDVNVNATAAYTTSVTATSYSVASNVVTFAVNAGHGVVVGSQILSPALGLGPLPQETVHSVSAVSSSSISVRFETANATSTNFFSPTAISVKKPVITGRNGVGGLVGRIYGAYASNLVDSVHLSPAALLYFSRVNLVVAGEDEVGGIAGGTENFAGLANEFRGAVVGVAADSNSIGGLVGRIYNSRWDLSYVAASVSSFGERTGGMFGMMDDRGRVPYCANGAITRLLTVEHIAAQTVRIVYPNDTNSQHLPQDGPVAVRLNGTLNDGAIGQITRVGTSRTFDITFPPSTTSFLVRRAGHPLDFVVSIVPRTADCDSGVYRSDFFGHVTSGEVSNSSSAGGIAGSLTNSAIVSSRVYGHIFGSGAFVGGAVGNSQGSDLRVIEVSNTDGAQPSVRGGGSVGGVAGVASGFFRNSVPLRSYQVTGFDLSFSGGDVFSSGSYTGGLIGRAQAFDINQSESAGLVEGTSHVGGLVGLAEASMKIIDSIYSGPWVNGTDGTAGGLAGAIMGTNSSRTLTGATARANNTIVRFTTNSGHLLLGGDRVLIDLVSEGIKKIVPVMEVVSETQFDVALDTDGSFSLSGSDQVVEYNSILGSRVTHVAGFGSAASIRADGDNVGGLAGSVEKTVVEDSFNKLQIRIGLGFGQDGENFGGLIGKATDLATLVTYIRGSYSTATIYTDAGFRDLRNLGGLVGYLSGYELSQSQFSGSILFPNPNPGNSATNIGGLVGTMMQSQISNAYAHTSITLTLGSKVGGLAGEQSTFGSPGVPTGIVGSFFDGIVSVTGGNKVGGLVGGGNQDISFSHVTGSVSAATNVGGLMGEPQSNASILNSYLDGQVTRTDAVTTNEVIGTTQNYTGNLTTAFWNRTAQTSQLTAGAKTATELATPSTFAGWAGFNNYFFMPAANLTTKPYPTLTNLAQVPGALTVSTPYTDLNGILEGTQIVPIQTTVWSYPRPVLHVVGTLPAGLSVTDLYVSGAPTSGGAYSFGLAAKNTAGTGPVTNFTGTIASLTPPVAPPYDGPFVSSYSPKPAIVGKLVRLSGAKLESVTEVKIGTFSIEPTAVTADSVSFIVPKLAAGTYDFTLVSGSGSITVQQGLQVVASSAKAASIRRQADGTVKIYHLAPEGVGKVQFFLNGREIAWYDSANPKTSGSRSDYLVRGRALAKGKNVIEVVVAGESVKRVVYSR